MPLLRMHHFIRRMLDWKFSAANGGKTRYWRGCSNGRFHQPSIKPGISRSSVLPLILVFERSTSSDNSRIRLNSWWWNPIFFIFSRPQSELAKSATRRILPHEFTMATTGDRSQIIATGLFQEIWHFSYYRIFRGHSGSQNCTWNCWAELIRNLRVYNYSTFYLTSSIFMSSSATTFITRVWRIVVEMGNLTRIPCWGWTLLRSLTWPQPQLITFSQREFSWQTACSWLQHPLLLLAISVSPPSCIS